MRLRTLRRLLRARCARGTSAAGALIAERAGLQVRELEAADEDAFGVLVAPAAFVEELVELVVGANTLSPLSGGGGTVDSMPSKGIVRKDVWVRIPPAVSRRLGWRLAYSEGAG